MRAWTTTYLPWARPTRTVRALREPALGVTPAAPGTRACPAPAAASAGSGAVCGWRAASATLASSSPHPISTGACCLLLQYLRVDRFETLRYQLMNAFLVFLVVQKGRCKQALVGTGEHPARLDTAALGTPGFQQSHVDCPRRARGHGYCHKFRRSEALSPPLETGKAHCVHLLQYLIQSCSREMQYLYEI